MKYLFVIALILFFGCKKPNKGVVVSKKYYPEYTSNDIMMIGDQTYIMPTHHDEKFYIRYMGVLDGDTSVYSLRVNKEVFNKYSIGDSIFLK